MWVDFDTLKSSSRIWIYQANRTLSAKEEIDLSNVLTDFCNTWKTHGQPMKSSFRIIHSQFVILAADEDFQLPSGCSIDSSVRMLKEWQAPHGLDFFDRTQIAFKTETGVLTRTLYSIKEGVAKGEVNERSITYDNLVPSKGDWQNRWEIPLSESWLSKYLPKSPQGATPQAGGPSL